MSRHVMAFSSHSLRNDYNYRIDAHVRRQPPPEDEDWRTPDMYREMAEAEAQMWRNTPKERRLENTVRL